MSKKKYKRGDKLKSVSELLEHDFFIMSMPKSEKTLHAGFVKSWQLQTCDKLIRLGMLYTAERIRDV